ncbi:MAG TPA: thermonuclease family protein [Fimbriimonadales bacterium]|nr:thermonuclease family protein [Fimbriimonadales bacterium]
MSILSPPRLVSPAETNAIQPNSAIPSAPLSTPPVPAERSPRKGVWVTGRVVGITDGDTFSFLMGGRSLHKIRLYGIDSPERGQAFGKKAKQRLSSLIYKRDVEILETDIDRDDRVIARVRCEGVDVCLQMVEGGYAWWFERYAPEDRDLERAELEARSARRGLWSDPHAIPPWAYRKLH